MNLRTFNMFGFRKEFPKFSIKIQKIQYLGKVKKPELSLKNKGLFLVTNLIRDYFSKNDKTDNFTHFHKFSYNNNFYYLPADSSEQHNDTNEELVIAFLNGDFQKIMSYDFSDYEDRNMKIYDMFNYYNKELYKKSYKGNYVTKEEKLAREYCKYKPNRDFGDMLHEETLTRTDDIDGTYIDNGYR